MLIIPKQMQIVVDNLMTYYSDTGKGRVVLLLHGWGDGSKTFAQLSHDMASKFRVIALDLPGFGKTQAADSAWNLDNYAEFAASFLKKLGVNETYAIAGHSNGGALAIRGLATGVLKAEKLVLLASAGIRNRNSLKRLIYMLAAKMGKLFTFWMPAKAKQKFRKALYGVAGSDMLVAPHLQETFKATVRQDVSGDAAKLVLPTLLIFGEKDRAVPLSDGHKFHSLIPNSKLVVLPGSDHFVHHFAATEVAKYIRDFLDAAN